MGLEMVKTIQVLLACYNGEAFLPPLLSSLRQQDDVSFSVLMQDDGSTDGTFALLRAALGDGFALGTEGGRHLGAIGNFLSLMRQSTADYAALCDQDDVWQPHKLSRCRAAMAQAEARYGADTPILVHSDARLVDGEGRLLQGSFFAHQGWDGAATGLARLLVQNNVTGCTLMMNAPLRRLVAAHAPAQGLHMHDWFIAQTAAAFGHIVFIPEPLVDYRQHTANVMGASSTSLMRRGAKALRQWQQGKQRIALTYAGARTLLEAYGTLLPPEARQVVEGYLATQRLPKLRRVAAVQKGGYTMQSTITRVGQMLLG